MESDIDIRTMPRLSPDTNWEDWQPKGQTLIELSVEERLKNEEKIKQILISGEEIAVDYQI